MSKQFGEILREIRTTRDLSQEDFANLLGTTKQVISRYENGQRTPKITVAKEYADKLGVPLPFLLDAEPAPSAIPPGFEPLPKMVKRPLVGAIACGEPITAEQNIEDYVDVPADVRCDFCLRCKGDSMIDANIQDGDVVFIHKQPLVEDGEIAAVRIDCEATLKRVYYDGESITLVPANRAYRHKTYSGQELESIQIEGKVTGFIHWFS